MNINASIASIIAITGWVLLAIMGMNLLSGHFDNRECTTDCVKTLYYVAIACGVVGLILAAVSFLKNKWRLVSVFSLLLSLGIVGLATFLYIAGNYF